MLVEKAKETGLLDEPSQIEEGWSMMTFSRHRIEVALMITDWVFVGGCRRSARHRYRPLKFYECEKINYKRDLTGLQVVDPSEPIVKYVPTPPKVERRRAPPRNRKKAAKKTRNNLVQDSDDDDDILHSADEHEVPLDGRCECIDPITNEASTECEFAFGWWFILIV